MATSVYGRMLAQKASLYAKDADAVSWNEDILVRILKSLDAEANKVPVSF